MLTDQQEIPDKPSVLLSSALFIADDPAQAKAETLEAINAAAGFYSLFNLSFRCIHGLPAVGIWLLFFPAENRRSQLEYLIKQATHEKQ